jgi:hypothetical protein
VRVLAGYARFGRRMKGEKERSRGMIKSNNGGIEEQEQGRGHRVGWTRVTRSELGENVGMGYPDGGLQHRSLSGFDALGERPSKVSLSDWMR